MLSYSIIYLIAEQLHNHQNYVPVEDVCYGKSPIYRMLFLLQTNYVYF